MYKETQRSCGRTRFRYRLNLYYWIPYGYVGANSMRHSPVVPYELPNFTHQV
ncbi:hypothetical protein JMJ77_0013497, partial [Colletotrichum scovillei]